MRPDIQRRGFTLIELLVVIGIIALLVSILLPTFSRARDLMRSAQTGARLQELDAGARLFYNDHRYYPGQEDYNQLLPHEGAADTSNYRTGSQVLAAALFGLDPTQSDLGFAPDSYRPKETYAPVSVASGDLDDPDDSVSGRGGTLLDRFPEQMPILYYPAIPGRAARLYRSTSDNLDRGAYNVLTNAAYGARFAESNVDDASRFFIQVANPTIDGATLDERDLTETDTWPTDAMGEPYLRPRQPDSFLLIAPGVDREYFTGDDNLNFNR